MNRGKHWLYLTKGALSVPFMAVACWYDPLAFYLACIVFGTVGMWWLYIQWDVERSGGRWL